MNRSPVLGRAFYARSTITVARALIGQIICFESAQGTACGRIIETEAYLGQDDDPASHAHRGPTPRSQIMFQDVGRAYVYFSYGAHFCLNVVAHTRAKAGAVLIRALEPCDGIELMKARRRFSDTRALCSGPGKLTQALGVTLKQNGCDFTAGPLTLRRGKLRPGEVVGSSPRIGISKAARLPYRFFIRNHAFLSRSQTPSPRTKLIARD